MNVFTLNMLFVTSFLCSYMNRIMIYSGIHVYDIIEWSQKTKSSPNISWLIDHSIKLRLHDISYYFDCSIFRIPVDVFIVYF